MQYVRPHVTWANSRILVNVNCGNAYRLIGCATDTFGVVMRITERRVGAENEYSWVTNSILAQ